MRFDFEDAVFLNLMTVGENRSYLGFLVNHDRWITEYIYI